MADTHMSLRQLRLAIQSNRVSFPAQAPVFVCQSRADIQWRLVVLYFVHNWSCAELGERYGVAMERIRQLISQWVNRATVLGYLQDIPASGEASITAPHADRKIPRGESGIPAPVLARPRAERAAAALGQ